MTKAVALLLLAGILMPGCKKEENVSQNAGKQVGSTVTNFVSGVGQGIDERLRVKLELSGDLPKDFDLTVSKLKDSQSEIVVEAYLISKHPVSCELRARALNADGLEIGRSNIAAVFQDNDAKYLSFPFNKEMDRHQVVKYVLEKK